MAASLAYRFDYIAPSASASVYRHGYSDNQAVNYSAVVYVGSVVLGAGFVTLPAPETGHISITQGETFRHVDDTVARKVYVQNHSPFNSCAVDILEIVEEF